MVRDLARGEQVGGALDANGKGVELLPPPQLLFSASCRVSRRPPTAGWSRAPAQEHAVRHVRHEVALNVADERAALPRDWRACGTYVSSVIRKRPPAAHGLCARRVALEGVPGREFFVALDEIILGEGLHLDANHTELSCPRAIYMGMMPM